MALAVPVVMTVLLLALPAHAASVACTSTHLLKAPRGARETACGNHVTAGPELMRVELAGDAIDRTVRDDSIDVRVTAVLRNDGQAPATLAIETRTGRRTEVSGNLAADSLWVMTYFGKRTRTDKPNCEFSHYVTVNCSLTAN